METKKNINLDSNMKLLLVFPVIIVTLFVFSQNVYGQKVTVTEVLPSPPPPPPPPPPAFNDLTSSPDKAEEIPFVVVEEMPMFPGGDIELLKYISEHTNYPEIAKENNIQGRVIIRFCVTAQGGVSQVSILQGVDPDLDKEAMRVVNVLPAFKPGRQGGKAVPVWYMVPVTFAIN